MSILIVCHELKAVVKMSYDVQINSLLHTLWLPPSNRWYSYCRLFSWV